MTSDALPLTLSPVHLLQVVHNTLFTQVEHEESLEVFVLDVLEQLVQHTSDLKTTYDLAFTGTSVTPKTSTREAWTLPEVCAFFRQRLTGKPELDDRWHALFKKLFEKGASPWKSSAVLPSVLKSKSAWLNDGRTGFLVGLCAFAGWTDLVHHALDHPECPQDTWPTLMISMAAEHTPLHYTTQPFLARLYLLDTSDVYKQDIFQARLNTPFFPVALQTSALGTFRRLTLKNTIQAWCRFVIIAPLPLLDLVFERMGGIEKLCDLSPLLMKECLWDALSKPDTIKVCMKHGLTLMDRPRMLRWYHKNAAAYPDACTTVHELDPKAIASSDHWKGFFNEYIKAQQHKARLASKGTQVSSRPAPWVPTLWHLSAPERLAAWQDALALPERPWSSTYFLQRLECLHHHVGFDTSPEFSSAQAPYTLLCRIAITLSPSFSSEGKVVPPPPLSYREMLDLWKTPETWTTHAHADQIGGLLLCALVRDPAALMQENSAEVQHILKDALCLLSREVGLVPSSSRKDVGISPAAQLPSQVPRWISQFPRVYPETLTFLAHQMKMLCQHLEHTPGVTHDVLGRDLLQTWYTFSDKKPRSISSHVSRALVTARYHALDTLQAFWNLLLSPQEKEDGLPARWLKRAFLLVPGMTPAQKLTLKLSTSLSATPTLKNARRHRL